MAVVQMRCPDRLTRERLSLYLDFMRTHAAQLLPVIIDQQDLEGCQTLLEHKLVQESILEAAIERANDGHHAEILLRLLHYQHQTRGPRSFRYEF